MLLDPVVWHVVMLQHHVSFFPGALVPSEAGILSVLAASRVSELNTSPMLLKLPPVIDWLQGHELHVTHSRRIDSESGVSHAVSISVADPVNSHSVAGVAHDPQAAASVPPLEQSIHESVALAHLEQWRRVEYRNIIHAFDISGGIELGSHGLSIVHIWLLILLLHHVGVNVCVIHLDGSDSRN